MDTAHSPPPPHDSAGGPAGGPAWPEYDFMVLPDVGILDDADMFMDEPLGDSWPTSGRVGLRGEILPAPPSSGNTLRGGPASGSAGTNGRKPGPASGGKRGGTLPGLSPASGAPLSGGSARSSISSAPTTGSGRLTGPAGKRAKMSASDYPDEANLDDDLDEDLEDGEEGTEGGSVSGHPGSENGDNKARRKKQIAEASRASRARRKRELEDLRDENKRLRDERSQFLSKIGELQMKVETIRERGATDMRVENELLRAQLEEHKRFVSCFKRLCDGAPTSLNARHLIYKQGSDSAQAHVLGIISQSQADDWIEAVVPPEAEIPFQNFSMFYKFKLEYGEPEAGSAAAAARPPGSRPRERLNIRIDALFPGMDATQIAEFFWNSFSNTTMQQRLYKVRNIELTSLADDMPDKETKLVYYREKWEAPKKDQDWVMICNRRRKELAKSTMGLPQRGNKIKPEVGKIPAIVLALTTTQHSVAPQFDNANRITSLFVQGAVTWNLGSDARLCCVFSFPEDFSIKAIHSFDDVIGRETGVLTQKFAEVLKSFREMMGEASGDAASPNGGSGAS